MGAARGVRGPVIVNDTNILHGAFQIMDMDHRSSRSRRRRLKTRLSQHASARAKKAGFSNTAARRGGHSSTKMHFAPQPRHWTYRAVVPSPEGGKVL
jgi:hypothetical protein